MNIKIDQNVVPSNSPRSVVMPHGVLYRFGYREIPGSGLSIVGECTMAEIPTVEYLKKIVEDYCESIGVHEEFNPSDYNL